MSELVTLPTHLYDAINEKVDSVIEQYPEMEPVKEYIRSDIVKFVSEGYALDDIEIKPGDSDDN